MTNGEKHIERLLSWYKEAVTEDGVCYLTSDDKNTLAYAIKCCKHFEDIKKDIDTWILRIERIEKLCTPNETNRIPTGLARPKGYWRKVDINKYACSKCNHCLTIDPLDNSISEMNTCPFCSADMKNG